MPETNRIEYKQKLTGVLGLVVQLGSAVPRILDVYSRDCFTFSDNFLRMSFLSPEMDYSGDTPQVTPQVEQLVEVLKGEMSRQELQEAMGFSDRKSFINNYINPALDAGVIEYTIPDKPNSKNQKYRLAATTPQVTPHDTPQVTPQVEQLVEVLKGEMSRQDLQNMLELSDRKSFINNYVNPALEVGLIEYTIPEKPNSSLQKYRLTEKGEAFKKTLAG